MLIHRVVDWAESKGDIFGIALVGSHARGEAGPDSDLDLIIVASNPTHYILDSSWVESFGNVESCTAEDWGLVTSLRVYFQDGQEVEFGLTSEKWVAIPADRGTSQVISAGMKILYDPAGLLANFQEEVSRNEDTSITK